LSDKLQQYTFVVFWELAFLALVTTSEQFWNLCHCWQWSLY